jgi:hypothetical protein
MRREARHPISADALIERKNGEQISATTLNVSGSGVLLDTCCPTDLVLGEEVACSIAIYAGKPRQPWGVGKIVRLERAHLAIEFTGIDWTSLPRAT